MNIKVKIMKQNMKMKLPQPATIRGKSRMVLGSKVLLGPMAPLATPGAVTSFIEAFTQCRDYPGQDALDRHFHCRALEDALRNGHRQLMDAIRTGHQTDVRAALAYREVALKAVRLLIDAIAHFAVRRQQQQQQLLLQQQQAKKKTEEVVLKKKEEVKEEGKEKVKAVTGTGLATEASKEPAGGPATDAASASSDLPSRSGKGEGGGGAGAAAGSKESIYLSVTDLSKDEKSGSGGSGSSSSNGPNKEGSTG